MNVTVIGLGAMGGGMARSLLRSDAVASVAGFDLNPEIVSKFYQEAKNVGKEASPEAPTELTLDRFINNVNSNSSNSNNNNSQTNVVLIVLVNEAQCESVCFGGSNGSNLESMLVEGSTVIVSSTVTPAWSQKAFSRFANKGIRFLDCPVSGGPVRALAGEITIMASGESQDLQAVDPLFQAMGAEIHIVQGGAGMGSTVKMVHQLLAGVHIAVAAEALALAAKAGLDVRQLYDIVKGAAGNSWMFSDRGKRMIEYTGKDDSEKVMSSLAIFIKDMDIVYSSAKTLKCPVPIATAALQQFIGGTGLGLDRKDDSQVVKVYEALSGVSVSACAAKNNSNGGGSEIGDVWVLPDGTKETIVDCFDECHHHSLISNDYTRVMKARIPAGDSARAHKHSEKSLYIFLTEGGIDFENLIQGSDSAFTDTAGFGEIRYAAHSPEHPLVHRLTNKDVTKDLLCIDAEILSKPPVTAMDPLAPDSHHVLVQTTEHCRVYKRTLPPGESLPIAYPFFFLSIVVKGSTVQRTIGTGPSAVSWEKEHQTGDTEWNPPSVGTTIANTGSDVLEQYIIEWC